MKSVSQTKSATQMMLIKISKWLHITSYVFLWSVSLLAQSKQNEQSVQNVHSNSLNSKSDFKSENKSENKLENTLESKMENIEPVLKELKGEIIGKSLKGPCRVKFEYEKEIFQAMVQSGDDKSGIEKVQIQFKDNFYSSSTENLILKDHKNNLITINFREGKTLKNIISVTASGGEGNEALISCKLASINADGLQRISQDSL